MNTCIWAKVQWEDAPQVEGLQAAHEGQRSQQLVHEQGAASELQRGQAAGEGGQEARGEGLRQGKGGEQRWGWQGGRVGCVRLCAEGVFFAH